MRNLRLLDVYRLTDRATVAFFGSVGDHECGAFSVPSPIDHASMMVIASSGEGWEHVSVSREKRCPNWPEMDHIKRLFFQDDEVAMQLHVAPKDHISFHPYCLHLWRPVNQVIPLPPKELVGAPKER